MNFELSVNGHTKVGHHHSFKNSTYETAAKKFNIGVRFVKRCFIIQAVLLLLLVVQQQVPCSLVIGIGHRLIHVA
jgi:hypothetical protein